MAKRELPVQKNQQIEVTIIDLTYEGMGVAKVDGYPLFIANALVGENCLVHVLRTGKKFGFAKVITRHTDSPDRVALRDEDGLRIGTMPLQHMHYDAQLAFKQKVVADSLNKFPALRQITVKSVIGMTDPWAYRNKAQVPVAGEPGHLYTGFYRKNTHQILSISDYHIQLLTIDETLQKVITILNQFEITAYNEESGKGLLRHLVVRKGYYTMDLMVILVINGKKLPHQKEIVDQLITALPQITSLVLNRNEQKTNVILGKEEDTLYGEPYYNDRMLGLDFKISPKSFFQVNTPQAEVLYNQAIEVGDIKTDEIVIDAYCGIGSISLCLAQRAKQVYGVEVVSDAITMAKANAEQNGIENVTFVAGKAEKVIQDWQKAGIKPDTVVVDPPRKGLAPDFVETVIALKPKKIVYVSCNPATLARDMALFVEAGYQSDAVQPVDLFPQTAHVECIVLIEKVK